MIYGIGMSVWCLNVTDFHRAGISLPQNRQVTEEIKLTAPPPSQKKSVPEMGVIHVFRWQGDCYNAERLRRKVIPKPRRMRRDILKGL